MAHSEMIDRVALAISGGDDPKSVLEIHRTRACSAIEAMRRPTDAIRLVFEELIETQCHHQSFDDGWAMLIDAALGTKPA
jgi:hypothetical protein